MQTYLYSGGVMLNLGVPPGSWASYAQAINNNGEIVGHSFTTNRAFHAFRYSCGAMVDLNTLLPSNSGWTSIDAQGINDSGEIVGYGISPMGQTNVFLLKPIALPPSPPVLGITVSGGQLGHLLVHECHRLCAISKLYPYDSRMGGGHKRTGRC